MNRVCIDTDILGWAVKGYVTDGDDGKVQQARDLIEYFREENITVIIPSIVVAEMLCDVIDEDEREVISDYVSANFFVAQFDILSAREFGKMNAEKIAEKEALRIYREQNNVLKCKMKNDWNICAIALSNQCDTIFTNNVEDFKKFAGDFINIESLDFVQKIKEQREAEAKMQKQIAKAQEEDATGGQVPLFPSKLEDVTYEEEE